jgi:hypothetical protein
MDRLFFVVFVTEIHLGDLQIGIAVSQLYRSLKPRDSPIQLPLVSPDCADVRRRPARPLPISPPVPVESQISIGLDAKAGIVEIPQIYPRARVPCFRATKKKAECRL